MSDSSSDCVSYASCFMNLRLMAYPEKAASAQSLSHTRHLGPRRKWSVENDGESQVFDCFALSRFMEERLVDSKRRRRGLIPLDDDTWKAYLTMIYEAASQFVCYSMSETRPGETLTGRIMLQTQPHALTLSVVPSLLPTTLRKLRLILWVLRQCLCWDVIDKILGCLLVEIPIWATIEEKP